MLAKPSSQVNRSKTVTSSTSVNKAKKSTAKGSSLNAMDFMFGAPSHTNELDELLVKEQIDKQKSEAAEKEREMAIEAKKKQKVNK